MPSPSLLQPPLDAPQSPLQAPHPPSPSPQRQHVPPHLSSSPPQLYWFVTAPLPPLREPERTHSLQLPLPSLLLTPVIGDRRPSLQLRGHQTGSRSGIPPGVRVRRPFGRIRYRLGKACGWSLGAVRVCQTPAGGRQVKTKRRP